VFAFGHVDDVAVADEQDSAVGVGCWNDERNLSQKVVAVVHTEMDTEVRVDVLLLAARYFSFAYLYTLHPHLQPSRTMSDGRFGRICRIFFENFVLMGAKSQWRCGCYCCCCCCWDDLARFRFEGDTSHMDMHVN
jgi:hypothetical protein